MAFVRLQVGEPNHPDGQTVELEHRGPCRPGVELDAVNLGTSMWQVGVLSG